MRWTLTSQERRRRALGECAQTTVQPHQEAQASPQLRMRAEITAGCLLYAQVWRACDCMTEPPMQSSCTPLLLTGNACSRPPSPVVPGAPAEAQLAWRALAKQAWEIARLYYEGPEKRIAWFNLGLNLLFQALMSLLFVVVSYTQASESPRPPSRARNHTKSASSVSLSYGPVRQQRDLTTSLSKKDYAAFQVAVVKFLAIIVVFCPFYAFVSWRAAPPAEPPQQQPPTSHLTPHRTLPVRSHATQVAEPHHDPVARLAGPLRRQPLLRRPLRRRRRALLLAAARAPGGGQPGPGPRIAACPSKQRGNKT